MINAEKTRVVEEATEEAVAEAVKVAMTNHMCLRFSSRHPSNNQLV